MTFDSLFCLINTLIITYYYYFCFITSGGIGLANGMMDNAIVFQIESSDGRLWGVDWVYIKSWV